MLTFQFEFLGWTVGLLATLAALAYVFVFVITHWAVILLVAAAITIYILKWARIFLVRMIVDYDANNGDGRVIIERLLPHPTLPETVQFPLQQAAQGAPEVNTRGLINTLITQMKGVRWLHEFTIGDLTLRGPAAPFGITMYSIKDPVGVKAKLEADWKKIETLKNKRNAAREREEQIDRVSEGLIKGVNKLKEELNLQTLPVVLIAPPGQIPPPSPSPVPPPEPSPMPWPPVSSLPAELARAARPGQPPATRNPGPDGEPEEESEAGATSSDVANIPLGASELPTRKADLSTAPGAESAPLPENNTAENSGQKPNTAPG
jgi:hypothetical protein